MRRSEKEITDLDELYAIIDKCRFVRIAFSAGDQPHVVPVCFGFEPGFLYFHCANSGLKIDMIKKNPNVCFQMDCDCEIVQSDFACKWGVKFKSIIGYGRAQCINGKTSKSEILSIIMKRYAGGNASFPFSDDALSKTCVVQVAITSLTGKRSGT